MKKIFIYLLISISIFFNYGKGSAATTWQQLNLEGKSVFSIAITDSFPDVVYVGTNYGIFKTEDGGINWKGIKFTDRSSDTVNALVIDPTDPNIVYAGAVSGVYKSTDGGNSWSVINGEAIGVSGLLIDPTNPNVVYVGGGMGPCMDLCGSYLYKTTDGGETWSLLLERPQLSDPIIAMAPADSQILYAARNDGIFKTTDGGNTWNLVNAEFGEIISLAIDPINSQTVYAGTSNGFYKTIDGGINWNTESILDGNIVNSIAVELMNPNSIYVGTSNGVFKTTDAGVNWKEVNNGLESGVNSLVINQTNLQTLYVGSNSGMYKSEDSGNRWYPINNGLSPFKINEIAVGASECTIYAATHRSGVFKSTDCGLNWITIDVGSNFISTVKVDHINHSISYVGTGNGIYKTVDGGNSWHEINNGLPVTRVKSLYIDPIDTQILYAGIWRNGTFKSTDGGNYWLQINTIGADSISIDPSDNQVIYIGTYPGILKSEDGGATWTDNSNGIGEYWVTSLTVDPVRPYILYAGTPDGGIYKTIDAGDNWTAVNNGLNGAEIFNLSVNPDNTEILYAATNLGVFKTLDGAQSWIPINNGLPSMNSVTSLAIGPKRSEMVFAGTNGNGLYNAIIPGLDVDEDEVDDNWESINGLNPNDPSDANYDSDNDGLSNLEEYWLETNPKAGDTDNDGVIDGFDGSPLDDQFNLCADLIRNDVTQDVFASVQAAVDDTRAVDYNTIQITAADFQEDILYDKNIILTLAGGFYCNFSDNPATSSINSLTIRNGKVIAENLLVGGDGTLLNF